MPEKREERTTEGGLTSLGCMSRSVSLQKPRDAKVRVSFIEPQQVGARWPGDGGRAARANMSSLSGRRGQREANSESLAAGGIAPSTRDLAATASLYDNVPPARCFLKSRTNDRHFIMGEALFVGLETAVSDAPGKTRSWLA